MIFNRFAHSAGPACKRSHAFLVTSRHSVVSNVSGLGVWQSICDYDRFTFVVCKKTNQRQPRPWRSHIVRASMGYIMVLLWLYYDSTRLNSTRVSPGGIRASEQMRNSHISPIYTYYMQFNVLFYEIQT